MIIDELLDILRSHGDKKAYINRFETIEYSKLLNDALKMAKGLKRQGNGPVIIYGHKESFVPKAMIACLLAKRTYIPVDYYVPKERIKRIIELSKASLIVSLKQIDIDGIECESEDGLTEYPGTYEYECNSDIAYIIFTSGSTGIPKGVPISRSNLSNFINWISNNKALKNYRDSVVLNSASFSFDLSVCDFCYSIFNGHCIKTYDSDGLDFKYLYDLLLDVDIVVSTPSFMKMVMVNKELNVKNYPSLKCIFFCGERLDVNLCDRLLKSFPDLKIINAYGPTEATCALSSIVIDEEMLNEELLPVGEMDSLATDLRLDEGQIILRGPSVFSGYLGNSDIIDEYHTGDYGEIIDNRLYIKGRIDNQIKYRGYRIELEEIESALLSINGIDNAAVIAKRENDVVVKIKAFAISCLNKKDIRNRLKESLPSYMIPDVIEIVTELPLNNNGKIDRKELENR